MPERDEDVAVVRKALDYLRTVQARKVAWRDEAYAALDRLQARLEAAEAELAYPNRGDRYGAALIAMRAERDKARADAENAKQAVVVCWKWMAECGLAVSHDVMKQLEALGVAAHTPHLTSERGE